VRKILITIVWVWFPLSLPARSPTCPELLKPPFYPPLARVSRTEGAVIARFSLTADGTATNVAATGHPLLVQGVTQILRQTVVTDDQCERDFEVIYRFVIDEEVTPGQTLQ
jgi:hypothetical protein